MSLRTELFSVLLCNSIYQQVCWFRTLASPTLGNVSMVITVSSPVWFCSCPFRIRAAVKVVIPIPDVMTREEVFFTPWNICVCGSRRVCVCVLVSWAGAVTTGVEQQFLTAVSVTLTHHLPGITPRSWPRWC